jgi:hypothetical protein
MQTDFRGVVGLQFGAAAGNTYVSVPFIPQVDRQTDTERADRKRPERSERECFMI